jgi:hypothetical protein
MALGERTQAVSAGKRLRSATEGHLGTSQSRRPGSVEGAYAVRHLYNTRLSNAERSDQSRTPGQQSD